MKILSKIIKNSGVLIMIVGLLGGIFGSFDYVVVISEVELPLLDWGTAVICIAIGAVLYGIGIFLIKKFGDIDAVSEEQPSLDMNDLGFIYNALKKTRKRNLIMGIFLGIFGLGMILLPLQSDENVGIKIGLGVFGGICLLIGIFGLVQFNKLINIKNSEIYRLIMYTPQNITGLTALVINSGFGKVGQAINATIVVDKKNKAVLSITENDLELLRQYLVNKNPNLLFEKKIQQTN